MTPSADVVEIAAGVADTALAPCDGLRVRRGTLEIGEGMAAWLARRKGKGADWHASRRLRRLEDVDMVFLLRSPRACRVLFVKGKRGVFLPRWRAKLPFHGWKRREDAVCLRGKVTSCLGARERKVLPVPFSGRPPLRLYHHGRLELYRGLAAPRAKPVGPDDAASIHLEGPGDEARFLFRAEQAGSLIVERTPGNLPNVAMLAGADERDLRPRGMIDLRAGEKALVVFRYRGAAPLDLDAGFLFAPDEPLSCNLKVVPAGPGGYRVEVIVRNTSDAPVHIFRPSAGTVDWYAGDMLIAAARPARLPEIVALGAGRSIRCATMLTAPKGARPTMARVRLGGLAGSLTCVLPPSMNSGGNGR